MHSYQTQSKRVQKWKPITNCTYSLLILLGQEFHVCFSLNLQLFEDALKGKQMMRHHNLQVWHALRTANKIIVVQKRYWQSRSYPSPLVQKLLFPMIHVTNYSQSKTKKIIDVITDINLCHWKKAFC